MFIEPFYASVWQCKICQLSEHKCLIKHVKSWPVYLLIVYYACIWRCIYHITTNFLKSLFDKWTTSIILTSSVPNIYYKTIFIYSCISLQCIYNQFYWCGLITIPALTSDHIHHNAWDEIIYPFPNFNGAAVEVWEWIRSFIPHLTRHVITHTSVYRYNIYVNHRPSL